VSLTFLVVLTAVIVVALAVAGALLFFRREDEHRETLKESIAAGLNQPASLHPVIDLDSCLTSGACVDACPEQVLGILDGKTQMVKAGECIGHGRCHAACPTRAISLVFGTSERGIDLPLLRALYETNVDGIFCIGELGGMGLIRNAMRQGLQVIDGVQKALRRPDVKTDSSAVDVIIIGGGPAGLACATKCVELGLTYELLEQYALGGSVMHYPRRKLVFTEVMKLPKVGRFGKTEMLKEELVAEFERVVAEAGIDLREGRRVTSVIGKIGAFVVDAEVAGGQLETYRGKAIVLAVGRRGTPRKLEVPGEDLPHVVYRLQDAEQFRHRKVLVVGGGDSAIEAAVACAQVAGCEVHVSYRGNAFYRVKKKNRDDIDAEVEAGRVTLHLETNVVRVTKDTVDLATKEKKIRRLKIDDVIVNVGGVLPTAFLEGMGVRVETKKGEKVEMGDSARQVAERITSKLAGAAEVSQKFAKAGTEFIKTASTKVTGRLSSGAVERPAAQDRAPTGKTVTGKVLTGKDGADSRAAPKTQTARAPKAITGRARRPDPLTTTEDLTPFTSDDKLTPVQDPDAAIGKKQPQSGDEMTDESDAASTGPGA
jgi:thioredoxin reductase (NADPH)